MGGCLAVILGLALPRLALIIFAIFTNWMQIAYDSAFWPILGWIFLPYTTLAYMVARINTPNISGWWVALIVVAVLIDLGVIGGGSKQSKK